MNKVPSSILLKGIRYACLLPLLSLSAAAQSSTWLQVTDGLYSWQDPLNWSTGVVPNGVSAAASFNDSLGLQYIGLDENIVLGNLSFGNSRGGYTLAVSMADTLTLYNDAIGATISNLGTASNVIATRLELADSTHTFHIADGNLVLEGVIVGSNGIVKTGDGTLWLRAQNTYEGITELNAGMTVAANFTNNSNALGATTAGNGTVIASGATLALGQINAGIGGINIAEPITVSGRGFRNNGAIRAYLGGNTHTVSGVITLAGLTRFHASSGGELTLSAALNASQDLEFTGQRLVNLSGNVSGSGTITNLGIGGIRFQHTTAQQAYNGTIQLNLGEIRAESGTATANPLANIAALNLRNAWLRMGIGQTSSTTVNDSRMSTTAPISMAASQIFLDNTNYAGSNLHTYAFSQTLGAVTLQSGANRIGIRSAGTGGSMTLVLTDLIMNPSNRGLTLELHSDSTTAGNYLGESAQNRILNSALEGGSPVAFVGGNVFANTEFVKYLPVSGGGNGYTRLVAADYAVNTAETGWTGAQNIKITTTATTTLTANRSIQSLNMQDATARTLTGNANTTLTLESGGLLTSGGLHVISVPFLTAGASSDYHLYNIAWSTNRIDSVITDNGVNPVSLVKVGGGTTSFFGANSYTGTTFMNEGQFRDVIGSPRVALGSGNLHFAGSPGQQSTYEGDRDFTRALGTGAGQVQFTGGGGLGGGSVGFSAYGRHIQVNLGGAGDPIVWGSATFNPGIFTLNGGNATHALTLVNPINLGGEQRYIRLDGNASGAGRGVIGILGGDVYNGGIVKRGGGTLIIDSPKSYENGTVVQQGLLWLRGGSLGANVMGNDIEIQADGALHIDSPDLIGSRQVIYLQNRDNNTPAAIGFGPGYGDGSSIRFNSFSASGDAPQGGGNNIFITDSNTGGRRIALQMNGMAPTETDLVGLAATSAANAQIWLGASTANGVYNGATLTPTGGAYRLGTGGGTLTISRDYVLTGANNLIVGAPDATARTNIGGAVYLPGAQDYSGTMTVGNAGILIVGQNAALSTGANQIDLRGGDLRLAVAPATYMGRDSQYAARNIDVLGANSTLRVESLGGSMQALVELGTLRLDGADRVLSMNSSTTRQNGVLFLGGVSLNHTATANQFLDIGFDNQGFNSGFMFLNGVVQQTGTGNKTLVKRLGGTLVLAADNTHFGTQIQQGNLVLAHPGAAGAGTALVTMNNNNDRAARVYFLQDGSGPHTYLTNLTLQGGNAGSTRQIFVGPQTVGAANRDAEIRMNNLSLAAVSGLTTYDAIFDGFHGYKLRVDGTTTLGINVNFRPRGALLTLNGVVSGAFNVTKNEQGTLWLNANNTYTGTTTIANGYVVLGHANGLGNASSNVIMSGTASSQLLLSGAVSFGRHVEVTATDNTRTLGGLDTGAKTFTGNLLLNARGANLTAQEGGVVTFTGLISGAGATGITKVGPGTVVLNPASGTGNTYSVGTTVQRGTLIGQAQTTSGSPFGAGPMAVNNGTLQLNGLGANSTTTVGALTIGGGARLVIQDTADSFNTTFAFASLARATNGSLTIVPQNGSLGGEERVSFTSAPTLVNGIVGTWAVAAASGANNAADYFTVSSGQVTLAGAYGGSGSIDGITAGSVWNAGATGGTLTANRSGFAFRSNADVDFGGNVLSLGASGQAGILLNSGADLVGAAGSALDIGVNQLNLYVDSAGTSTLAVPLRGFRPNQDNTVTTVSLVKFGQGNLVLQAPLTNFENSIQINEGTLTAGAAHVFPMFNNLNARTGSIVTINPGATLDLAGFDQEIGNLSGPNPSAGALQNFQNTGGTLILGGATLTVGRQSSAQTFAGQIVGGAGSKIIKIGTSDLNLTNINGLLPNSLDVLQIDQGNVLTRADDNSWATPGNLAFSLPGTTEVILRGGRWNLRSVGDSTSNQQTILVGNNVTVVGGNSVLSVDRPEGSGSNKHLLLGNFSVGLNNLTITAANSYTIGFQGPTTFSAHPRIQTDTQLVLRGAVNDGGNYYTLNKVGASDFGMGADSSASWNGGLVITQGLLYFGIRGEDEILAPGNTISGKVNANAGTGTIVLNQGFTVTSALRLFAPSNILTGQGQTVQNFGSERSGTGRIDLGVDAPLTAYGLRSTTNGSLSFGIGDGGFYTTPLDQSMMGNGKWGISAFQGSTYYTPATLGAGIDNVYRFTGNSGGILGLAATHVLTGTASVELGRNPLHVGNVPTNTTSQVRTYGSQNYTGNTTIHRGADFGSVGNILYFHGEYATPRFENYGRLEARGDARFTDLAGNQINEVILRPGSSLRLDYNMDVNDQFNLSRQDNSNLGIHENKWGDTTPLFIDGAQFHLTSANGRVSQELVGQISAAGGASILLERIGTGQPILVTQQGVTRIGQATLAIRNTTAAELGSIALQSQKFFINDAAWITANRANGMLSPWMVSYTNGSFVDYVPGSETGMTNAAWTNTGNNAAFLAGLTATSRALYDPAANTTLSGTANTYALRVNGTSTLTGSQINIHSGGLIVNGTVTFASNVYFGNGTVPTEGILHALADNATTFTGIVTAANFTKAGINTVTLSNANNAITGNLQLNGGTLIADVPGALGSASVTLHASYQNNNNAYQMPILSLRTASANGTYNNAIIVGENVPIARIDTNRSSGSGSGTITISGLNILGTSGAAGTLVQFENNNSYNLTVTGPVSIGGTSDTGIRVSAGTVTWNGAVTGNSANLIKTGDGALTLNLFDPVTLNLFNHDLPGGLILNRGTVTSQANSGAQTFRSDIVINFGQLIVGNTTGSSAILFDNPGQKIFLNGQATIRNQRFGSGTAHMQIGINNNGNQIITSNSPWLIFQANSFGDQFNIRADMVINDAPWFRVDSAFVRTFGTAVVSGEGRINKVGGYYFGFENDVPNTYAGGTDIWAGEFMVRSTAATMGTGAVRLFPGAALAVRNVANLGTTGVTDILTSAGVLSAVTVRNNDNGNAQFDAVVNAMVANASINGNGNLILALGGGRNYTADPDMANRNGGLFANSWIGATEGSGTISANSVAPWGPGGNEFRLGAASYGNLTMNPATAGSAQLSGATNRLIVGAGHSINGYSGGVSIGANANNDFGGGTLVTQGRDRDASFRGSLLQVQGGQTAAATFRTPLGSGQVDLFGELRILGASATARNSANTNANVWVFHPGSRMRFDNGGDSGSTTANTFFNIASTEGRWADAVAIALNTSVLEIYGANSNNAYNSERVGNLSAAGGSEVVIRRRGANWAEILAGDLSRSGSGTLMITTMVDNTNTAAILGTTAGTASATRFLVANGASLMHNNMVAPWIISRVDGQFLKYDETLGFQLITQGGNPANYVSTSTTTLTAAVLGNANDGSRILNLTGGSNFTLGENLDIHALRLERDINVASNGSANNIIIRSGGLTQFANTPTINANLYFGVNGDGTGEALIHASNNTLQINGRIHASQVTKFGTAFLSVRSDQPQFTGDWVVQGGGIQFLTPGAASTGQILLNGSRMNDRDNTYNLTEVRFNFNPGTPDLFTWQHGKITAVNFNRIYGIAASDRLIAIGDIDLKTSNAVAGQGQEGAVTLRMDGLRSTMRTGTVTLFDHYLLNLESDRNTGATTGVEIGVLNNQGQFNARKSGIAMLTLNDNSSTFTNGTFAVANGGLRVMHNGAFGNATSTAIIDPTGALEIAVPNWTPLATVTQAWGSTERWAVNQARGAGDYDLPAGVHLQIMATQTGTRTLGLNGGSIMGYVPTDWDQAAINHYLTTGITIELGANSYLGQLYPAGVSNGNNNIFYDMGKLNTSTNLNPNDPGLRGSYLHILGNITGNYDLTKVGQDVILLAGTGNTFRNTNIENGILQIGANNVLPVTTELTTRFSGMFDLNGNNQEVAALKGTGGSVHNGGFALNQLVVNQAADTVYGGRVDGNVTLVKNGPGSLTLTGVSAMRGDLIISGGSVALTGSGSVSESRWISVGAGTSLDVSGRTGGSYTYDGLVSGGGVGVLRADNASRGRILGSLSLSDNAGTLASHGALRPGGSSGGAFATAGDQIGHLQITGDLSFSGGRHGSTTKTERLTLQLAAPTSTLAALGWDGSALAAWLTANAAPVLNGEQGDLSGHDYVNVGGAVTLNEHGTVGVALTDSYSPAFGDIFNLLDWTSITANTFSAGPANRVGGESGYDLNLPDLSAYQLGWNTELFLSHGVLVVAPEPGRMLLVFLGLAGLCLRRRR